MQQLPEPVVGAVEAVAWARAAGIPLALVTSAGTRWVVGVLEPFGGADVFATTVAIRNRPSTGSRAITYC